MHFGTHPASPADFTVGVFVEINADVDPREIYVEILVIFFRKIAQTRIAANVALDPEELSYAGDPFRFADFAYKLRHLFSADPEPDMRKSVFRDRNFAQADFFRLFRIFHNRIVAVRVYGVRMVICRKFHLCLSSFAVYVS